MEEHLAVAVQHARESERMEAGKAAKAASAAAVAAAREVHGPE